MNKNLTDAEIIKKLLKKIETLETKLEKSTVTDKDIAVIGMECIFPGGANNLANFWRLLADGYDGITKVPPDRWSSAEYYDPDADAAGKINNEYGGFIERNIREFDSRFFGISANEAKLMDPQQRLLLETTWNALENAGINIKDIKGTATGVYIAIATHDYEKLHDKYGIEKDINAYKATGNAFSVAAGRISYTLGLTGPAIVVDTACSSSLVAVHLAVQALREKQIDLAIVGGVNLLLAPDLSIYFSKAHMLSGDGHCKTFDASADGYVRGEGCGVVILKRLEDAKQAKDRISALVKGSAINQDGASSGLTVPNGLAQKNVIQQALYDAAVEPATISYIEAHGTGTSLGDPIEIQALTDVYSGREQPLYIGSVKTNIGHLEAAAGIAGLIKTILCVENNYIVPHINFKKLNPLIDIEGMCAKIPQGKIVWESNNSPRRAGVSSFGFSGTNAHVILEEYKNEINNEQQDIFPCLLLISAKYEDGVRQLIEKYIDYLEKTTENLKDITYTSQIGRDAFNYRISVVGKNKDEIIKKLKQNYNNISKANENIVQDFPEDLQWAAQWFSKQNNDGSDFAFLLKYNDDNFEKGLNVISELYNRGYRINWKMFSQIYPSVFKKVAIPIYPFQKEIYWFEYKNKIPQLHPFLKNISKNTDNNIIVYDSYLTQEKPDFIKDHNLAGRALLSSAAYISAIINAAVFELNYQMFVISNLSIYKPIWMDDYKEVELQICFEKKKQKNYKIHFKVKDRYANNANFDDIAFCELENSNLEDYDFHLISLENKDNAVWDLDEEHFFSALLEYDVNITNHSRWIKEAWCVGNKGYAKLRLPKEDEKLDDGYIIHPGCIESCVFLISYINQRANTSLKGEAKKSFVVSEIKDIACFNGEESIAYVCCEITKGFNSDLAVGDACFFSSSGKPVLIINGLSIKTLTINDIKIDPVVNITKIKEENFIKNENRDLPLSLEDIKNTIVKEFSDVLGYPPDKIEVNTGFSTQGMDSLMAVALAKKMREIFGESIITENATLFYEFPTVEKLSEEIYARLEKISSYAQQSTKDTEVNITDENDNQIAIIGFDCRFPGGSESPEEYWNLLINKQDGISEVPTARWDNEFYYHPDPDMPGKINTRMAGILKSNIARFDAAFFSISPKEALKTDPQQRILLESVWYALENSGIPAESLIGSKTGVYVGIWNSDYNLLLNKTSNINEIDAYTGLGASLNGTAGHIAFSYGFNGPTMPVDTACSSSLVAIHLACESLLSGSCDMAIACGVNLLLDPCVSIHFTKAHMLAGDGHCKTFDKAADGYVRSEGVGVLVLKRLKDALQNGDIIYGIIESSGVNQDGASGGFTVPNVEAQKSLMKDVLNKANVNPSQVDYIELHGTGTNLGDPLEYKSIAAVYGNDTNRTHALILGAVKSNIGHLESAAGVAGVIKILLAMQHGKIPANLHFNQINPLIDLSIIPAIVPTEAQDWVLDKPRRAVINSFGASGTNCTLLLKDYKKPSDSNQRYEISNNILVISAKDIPTLHKLTERYLTYLLNTSDDINDICYTSQIGRCHFKFRVALIAHSKQEFIEKLKNRDFIIEDDLRNLINTGLITCDIKDKIKTWRITTEIKDPRYSESLLALAKVYIKGEKVNWPVKVGSKKVVLPNYVFAGEYYWAISPSSFLISVGAQNSKKIHPLIVDEISQAGDNAKIYRGFVSLDFPDFIKHHLIFNNAIVSASTFISAVISIMEYMNLVNFSIVETKIVQPMVLLDKSARELQIRVINNQADNYNVEIYSKKHNEEEWKLHVLCQLESSSPLHNIFDGTILNDVRCGGLKCDIENLYAQYKNNGLELGEHFRWLQNVWIKGKELLGELREPYDESEVNNHVLYPGLIDSIFQTVVCISLDNNYGDAVMIPFAIENIVYKNNHAKPKWIYVNQYHDSSIDMLSADIYIYEKDFDLIGQIKGLTLRKAPKEKILSDSLSDSEQSVLSYFYESAWEPLSLPEHYSNTQELNLLVISESNQNIIYKSAMEKNVKIVDYTVLDENTSDDMFLIYSNKVNVALVITAGDIDDIYKVYETILKFFKFLLNNPGKIERAWILTQGAYAVSGNQINLSHSVVNGMVKALYFEQPQIILTQIDFTDQYSFKSMLDTLVRLNDFPREQIIAVRNDKMYSGKIYKKNITTKEPKPSIDSDAVYLITGGNSKVAQRIKDWLVECKVKKILLVSRNVEHHAAQNVNIDDTVIEQISCDLGRKEQVQNLMAKVLQENYPLKGVFHLSGIISDALLPQQDMLIFKNVFNAKSMSAWYLHYFISESNVQLDYFVMFSSIASFIGNAGQINYAAANAFLDGLAVMRKSNNLAATSISWGPWSESGMTKALQLEQLKYGFHYLKPEETLIALKYTIMQSAAHMGVFNVNWAEYSTKSVIFPSWLTHLVHDKKIYINYLSKLNKAKKSDKKQVLKEILLDIITSTIGLSAAGRIEDNVGFYDVGMDSLLALEIQNKINKYLNIKVNDTVAFDYPTLSKLTDYIADFMHITSLSSHEENTSLDAKQYSIVDKEETTKETESIAIIGMACRFPGGAENLEQFWELLKNEQDARTTVTRESWNIEGTEATEQIKNNIQYACLLSSDIKKFDADFFRINPREAKDMDPQHRILLEVCWQAFESANIIPTNLAGTDTGVFIGISSHDYEGVLRENKRVSSYFATGNSPSTAAGRISFFFDFKGPCFAIDTACSSSLVALHNACEFLNRKECNIALVGGVNLLLRAESSVAFAQANMLAPDGKCKAFDQDANGYVRGEGCGVIILKRLSEALKCNDKIYAVIKGSAIDHDGASGGLTVPNGPAQEHVIKTALKNANLMPRDIDYIECHGTGTPLGDPIEVNAIANIFEKHSATEQKNPLVLGTVKTNIGHLEAAAGIAGLIKVVLALKNEYIPKHLHFNQLNKSINLNDIPAQLPLKAINWKKSDRVRRAGISSFGFSGTNAHVIVEEAPQISINKSIYSANNSCLLVITEKSKSLLEEQLCIYLSFLENTKESIEDICLTSQYCRVQYKYKIGVVGKTIEELISKIKEKDFIDDIELDKHYCSNKSVFNKVELPSSLFRKEEFWVEKERLPIRAASETTNFHPLLQRKLTFPGETCIYYESFIELNYPNFIKDHVVHGYPIIAGAAYISLGVTLCLNLSLGKIAKLSNIEFIEPLIIFDENEKTIILVKIEDGINGKKNVLIYGKSADKDYELKARMDLVPYNSMEDINITTNVKNIINKGKKYLKNYIPKKFSKIGLELGRHFLWNHKIHVIENEFYADIRNPQDLDEKNGYILHPGLIDSCFQGIVTLLSRQFNELYLPSKINEFIFDLNAISSAHVHGKIDEIAKDYFKASYKLFDSFGRVVGLINGFVGRRANLQSISKIASKNKKLDFDLYELEWQNLAYIEDSLIKQEPIIYDARCKNTNEYELQSLFDLLSFLQKQLVKNDSNRVINIITEAAYAINNEDINLNQSTLNAFIKSVILEYPQLKIRQIDVEKDSSDFDILCHNTLSDESLMVYRNGKIYKPRIVINNEWMNDIKNFDVSQYVMDSENDFCYLITGGFGDIGMELARHFACRGVKNLVLAGRTRTSAVDDLERELNNMDVKVTISLTDLNDEDAVDKLIELAHSEKIPLKGIFHAAGILDDAAIVNQDNKHIETVFFPKARAAWFLHNSTKKRTIDLDYFIIFSSIASLLGAAGQSNYAAANGFLDALCIYRKQQKLPATSIQWGPWKQMGMSKKITVTSQNSGMEMLEPISALTALDFIMFKKIQQPIGVLKANWQRIAEYLMNIPSWLEHLAQKTSNISVMAYLEEMPEKEWPNFIKKQVEMAVREALGITADKKLDENQGFFDMGLDSIVALELRNKLQSLFPLALDNLVIFDYSTINDLSNKLLADLQKKSLKKETENDNNPNESITQLTDDEIENMLNRYKNGQ